VSRVLAFDRAAMGPQLAAWTFVLLLSLVPGTICDGEAQVMATGSTATDLASEPTATAPVEVNRQYGAHGFLFEQYDDVSRYNLFTEHEIEVLGGAVVAFADLAGGPPALSMLVDGPVRVRRDLRGAVSYTQAGQVIGLGRGAFDLAVTEGNNYYAWGAESGAELAQVVLGHEIGHRWIETLRREQGVDWGAMYGQHVWRGERASAPETWAAADGVSPEEEAATNLALYALGRNYRWTFLNDVLAGKARQVWIDGWIYDLVANSN
jgi:hypothetical protein